jgi:lipopolysaccharide transport system permease protein
MISHVSEADEWPGGGSMRHLIAPSRRFRSVDFRELWRYRGVFMAMTRRDLTLRYRQTILGPAWIVLQPLLGAGIFAFVFGSVIKFKTGVPYFLFAYSGLMAWNPFSNTVTSLSPCLVTNANLVGKIYFPRILLPLAQVGSKLLDFGVSVVVFVIAASIDGLPFTWKMATIPLWMILAFTLAVGPGLACAAANVSYRDVATIVTVAVPFLLYLSPIAYSTSDVPHHLQVFFRINPLVGLVEGFRWSLLGKSALDTSATIYSVSFALVAFVAGTLYFRSHERRFADDI